MGMVERGKVFALFSMCAALIVSFPLLEAVAGPNADEVLAILPVTDSERRQIMEGKIVQWTTTESSDREVVLGKALLVRDKQPNEVIDMFRQALGFGLNPDVRAFGRITGKGSTADFEEVVLEPHGDKETQRYLKAAPGGEFNLNSQEITALHTLNVNGQGPADRTKSVEKLLRSLLLARYQAYQAKGLLGIGSYARDGGTEVRPADELVRATMAAKVLARYAPSFHRVLLKYPEGKPAGLEEWFHWLNIEVSSRPNFVLSHRLALQSGGSFFISDRHFYVSHEYNSLQAVGGLLSSTEGTLAVYLYRVSTDQVAGFGSSVKRALARVIMGKPIRELFENLRTLAEKE